MSVLDICRIIVGSSFMVYCFSCPIGDAVAVVEVL